MWSKRSILCSCAVLALILVTLGVILKDKSDCDMGQAVNDPLTITDEQPPKRETLISAPPEKIPDKPLSTITTQRALLPYIVKWKSSRMPVKNACLSLLLSVDDKFHEDTTIQITTVSNESGEAWLSLPEGITSATAHHVRLSLDYPDARPFFKQGSSLDYIRMYQGQPYIVWLEKEARISGTVYWKPDGAKFIPAIGAKVVSVTNVRMTQSAGISENLSEFCTITDAEGHYEINDLPFSPQQVWATLNDHVVLDSPKPVMPKTELNEPHDIYLERGATLTALVSAKNTLLPISGAEFIAEYADGNLFKAGTTDVEGFCQLVGLPVGSVCLTAWASGYEKEQVPFDIASSEHRGIPFFLGRGGRVRIMTVHAKTKRPVSEVSIEISEPSMRIPVLKVTDADGVVEVTGIPLSSKVSVSAKGDYEAFGLYRNKTYSVSENKTTDITLEIMKKQKTYHKDKREYHTVKGKVVDEQGSPVASALVFNNGCCSCQTVSNSAGEFVLEGVHVRIFPVEKEPFSLESAVPESVRQSLSRCNPAYKELLWFKNESSSEEGIDVPCYVSPAILSVEASGHAPAWNILASVDSITSITLPNKSKGELTAKVCNKETLEPIQDFQVTITGNDLNLVRRFFSEEGRFKIDGLLPNLNYFIEIKAEGYITKKTNGKADDRREDILLEPSLNYNIMVLDGDTLEPVEGVVVLQVDFSPPLKKTITKDQFKNIPFDARFVTGKDGLFTLSDLSMGGSLIILAPEHEVFSIPLRSLSKYKENLEGSDIYKIRIENPTASLSANVVLGKRIVEKEEGPLLLERVTEQIRSSPNLPEPIYSDAQWHWKNLNPGRYRLSCRIRGESNYRYISKLFIIERAESTFISIGEGYTGSVSGRVRDSEGKAYQPKHIVFRLIGPNNWRDGNSFTAYANPEGYYRIDYMTEGAYEVRVSDRLNSKVFLETDCKVVEVTGDTALPLILKDNNAQK